MAGKEPFLRRFIPIARQPCRYLEQKEEKRGEKNEFFIDTEGLSDI